MLDLVVQLGQDAVGDVPGILGAEIDTHALGTDELHHLLDLLQQGLGSIGEQQMGFIEEEDHLGLIQVPHFREHLEEFGQEPEQEGGIEPSIVDQR